MSHSLESDLSGGAVCFDSLKRKISYKSLVWELDLTDRAIYFDSPKRISLLSWTLLIALFVLIY